MTIYQHSSDVQIGVDCTDHVAFFCPNCDSLMNVVGVRTKSVLVNALTSANDKCTWVYLRCRKCRTSAQRKFYWTVTDLTGIDHRTDHLDRLPPSTPLA
jgi:hypothetical protein